MDVENFFEDLSEKNWKRNTHTEASYLFDQFLDMLKESREEIIKKSIKDINILEEMKIEEGQEFTYRLFKEWITRCMIDNIYDELDDE